MPFTGPLQHRGRKYVGFRWPDPTAPRESDNWSLERDGLSPSYMSTFLECREQFRLALAEGWKSTAYNFAQEFGNLWHWLHRNWVAGDRRGIIELLKHYRKVGYKGVKTPKTLADQEVIYLMTAPMWPIYTEFYKKDLDRQWMMFEESVVHEFRYSDGVGEYVTRLVGQLDGAFVQKKKFWWVHEMKTKAQPNPQQMRATLHMDPQTMTYCTLLELELKAKKIKGEVGGIDYDIIRRPGIKPRKDETNSEYMKRLGREVEKDPDYYFHRVPFDVNAQDLADWRQHFLTPLLLEIRRWTRFEAPHYVNPKALLPRPFGSSYFGLIAHGDKTGMVRGRPFDHHLTK